MNADRPLPTAMAIILLLTSAVFFLLGTFFILVPVAGGRVYGLETHNASALFYVRAIGLRDLAVASYILGLTVVGHRPAPAILLAFTTVIPTGDLLLLGLSGTATVINYVLHAISLIGFAVLAFWVRP